MSTKTIVLRPYQQEAINLIEGNIAMGSTELILSAETSFGKGICIAAVAKRYYDQGVMIIINIEPLLDQIASNLKLMNIDYSLLKAGREKEFDNTKKIQLVMAQTLYARIDKVKFKHNFYLVQQDESHREWNTKRTNTILKKIKPEVRLSYSATPWDERGYKLTGSEIINTISCAELTEQKYLSPIKYYVPKWAERVDYSKIKKSGNDYSMSSLDELIGSGTHIKNIITSMNQLDAKNKKTLIFCTTIEVCDKLEKALSLDGYSVAAYHSKKSTKENHRVMQSFKHNTQYTGSDQELDDKTLFSEEKEEQQPIKTIVSVSKVTTGFSVEDIDLGVMVRKSLISSLWRQCAGRVRRLSNSLDNKLKELENINNQKIAFVASVYNEVNQIEKQLKKKNITDIDVFSYGSEPDGYTHIETNIRPNKEHGIILDASQMLSLHGFPEDLYDPPVRQLYDDDNKQAIEDATKHLKLEHLEITLDDKLEPITRDKYELKIKEIKSSKKKLSEMTIRELSAKMELEQDPMVIVAILATLFDKIHCTDMVNKWGAPTRGYRAKNGKDVVNFRNPNSIEWISELWTELLPQQDAYHKQKYLKAMRTRSKNLLKEKGSIWSIRFFISWLIDQDVENNPEPEKEKKIQVTYEGFDIADDEIPFGLLLLAH